METVTYCVCVTPHIDLWKNKDGINSVHVQVKRTYVFLSMQATIEIIGIKTVKGS